MTDDIITIDKSKLLLSRDKAGELVLKKDAEAELRKVLELKKFAESLYDWVQDKLGQAMNERKIKKVIAGNIVVRYGYHGERYQIREGTDEKYTKEVVYTKPNAETIDEFVESNGELPEGVVLKERNAKASISFREEE